MPITLKDKMKELSPAQRKKVEARAADLIAEEMTLRELRHARKLTQVKMAKTLGVTQDSVSRLEKRSDLLLSTLRNRLLSIGPSMSRSVYRSLSQTVGHKGGVGGALKEARHRRREDAPGNLRTSRASSSAFSV